MFIQCRWCIWSNDGSKIRSFVSSLITLLKTLIFLFSVWRLSWWMMVRWRCSSIHLSKSCLVEYPTVIIWICLKFMLSQSNASLIFSGIQMVIRQRDTWDHILQDLLILALIYEVGHLNLKYPSMLLLSIWSEQTNKLLLFYWILNLECWNSFKHGTIS